MEPGVRTYSGADCERCADLVQFSVFPFAGPTLYCGFTLKCIHRADYVVQPPMSGVPQWIAFIHACDGNVIDEFV